MCKCIEFALRYSAHFACTTIEVAPPLAFAVESAIETGSVDIAGFATLAIQTDTSRCATLVHFILVAHAEFAL